MGIQSGACGQAVEFSDGKSLPVATQANLLKTRELIGDKNWLAAARQALELMETSGDRVFPIRNSKNCQVFCNAQMRTQILVCSWAKNSPQALNAYRDLIDAEAQTLFRQANQNSSVNILRTVANKYFASRVGDQACRQLAEIEFEAGNFLLAAKLWDSLVAVDGYPTNSLLKFPDSDIAMQDLISKSIGASLLATDFESAESKLNFLTTQYANSQFELLGKTGLGIEQLKKEYNRVKSRIESVLNPDSNKVWLDINGRASASFRLEPQSNSQSPYWRLFPLVGEPDDLTLATLPDLDGENVYWCDTHHVYEVPMANQEGPNKQKRGLKGESSEPRNSNEAKKIWSTPFPNETAKTERKKLGRPLFDVELDDRKLFARMGDPRTSYRNDGLTRNRSYVVGLDLERGGTLLAGFPIENSDPRVEFDATPRHKQGFLYVSKRKTYRDNATAQIIIECLELSPSNRTSKPKVVWSKRLVSAESNNRGLWDEVSRSKLLVLDQSLIYLGAGFLVSLDRSTGRIEWITDYYRDRFEFSREKQIVSRRRGPSVRKQDELIYHRGYFFFAPSDSEYLLCVDAATGNCRWKAHFPNVTHLLGATDKHLLAGGHRLNWIDLKSGQLKSRFPATIPDSPRGFGLPEDRGFGRGSVDGGIVYWPTMNKIFALDTQLNRRQQDQAPDPVLRHIFDLRSRRVTGGNLHVENGIMLLATEREIKLFVD